MFLYGHENRTYQKNVINAFLQLRSCKPLEKITVKDLSALAEINKATFYLHYHDVYDLSEQLENEVVFSTLHSIEQPELIFSDTKRFTRELTEGFLANEQLINILFEGSRSSCFVTLFDKELKNLIIKVHPEYEETLEKNAAITYLIYGGYYTYFKYGKYDKEAVFTLIENMSDAIVKLYELEKGK